MSAPIDTRPMPEDTGTDPNIPGLFYSCRAADLPGFEPIAELSRAACVIPRNVPSLVELPEDHPYARLRRELDDPPRLPEFEAREALVARRKWGALAADVSEEGIGEISLEDLRSAVFPGSDAGRLNELMTAVSDRFGVYCQLQGDFYYPPGGFRTWHTNRHDVPGWRMYVVDVDRPDASWFRYLHRERGELVTVWDRPSTVNFFHIDPERPFWHCIGSGSAHRWSKGFVVPEEVVMELVR